MNKATFSFLSNQILGPDEEGFGNEAKFIVGPISPESPGDEGFGNEAKFIVGPIK